MLETAAQVVAELVSKEEETSTAADEWIYQIGGKKHWRGDMLDVALAWAAGLAHQYTQSLPGRAVLCVATFGNRGFGQRLWVSLASVSQDFPV